MTINSSLSASCGIQSILYVYKNIFRNPKSKVIDDDAPLKIVSKGVWLIELPPMSVGTSCNVSIFGNGRYSFHIGF